MAHMSRHQTAQGLRHWSLPLGVVTFLLLPPTTSPVTTVPLFYGRYAHARASPCTVYHTKSIRCPALGKAKNLLGQAKTMKNCPYTVKGVHFMHLSLVLAHQPVQILLPA